MQLSKGAVLCLTLLFVPACWVSTAMRWAAQQLNPASYSTIMPHKHEPPTHHKGTLKQLVSELDKPKSKVIVVGAPGVGKTTLLHALAGQTQALGSKEIVLIQADRIRQLAPIGSSESTYAWLLRRAMDYWVSRLHGKVVFAIDDVHYILHPDGEQGSFLLTALQSPARIVITTTDTAYSKLLDPQMHMAKPHHVVLGLSSNQ